MNAYLSIKLRWLSIVAAVCVVISHCPLDGRASSGIFKIVYGLVLWDVPCFFLISGYFFAHSLSKYDFLSLIRRKMETLVLPFVIWCVIRAVVSGNVGCLLSPLSAFGVTVMYPVGNTSLWFLRTLVVLNIVVGFIYYMMPSIVGNRRKNILVVVIALFVFVAAIKFHWSGLYGTPSSPFWFIIGFVLATEDHCSTTVFERISYPKYWGCNRVVVMGAFLLMVSCIAGWWKHQLGSAFNVLIVCQLIYIFLAYDYLPRDSRYKAIPPRWLTHTFILYCAHGMLVDWLHHWWIRVFGVCALSSYFAFFTLIILVPILVLKTFDLVCLKYPRFYKIISGSRS